MCHELSEDLSPSTVVFGLEVDPLAGQEQVADQAAQPVQPARWHNRRGQQVGAAAPRLVDEDMNTHRSSIGQGTDNLE
jgi:hypothetical protein